MKFSRLTLLLVLTFLFVSCSEVQPLPVKTKPIEKSATVLVSMYDDSKDKNSYRIFIDYKDINATLKPNDETLFNVKEGSINIQVVKKRETASIDLVVQKDKLYRLRIFKDERNHIQLLQVSNSSRE